MILGIIPARYASTRFPGKPLVDIQGKSMIQRVYEQASKAQSLTKVVVATDDLRIYNHVLEFGGTVCMTRPEHPSGTDRCAEAFEKSQSDAQIIVNVQGDEPFIDPRQIEELVALMNNTHADIGTLCQKTVSEEAIFNPNVVKLVKSTTGKALYFSRSTIPFVRGENEKLWKEKAPYFRHLGMYAYTSKVLLEISKLPPGQLELAENLEQLRWLEAGYNIYVAENELETIGIDSPEDLLLAEEFLRKSKDFQ
jgi:3-deoxy-manno-octulosonate cytidylyltransferase (CMP-KDO synthetase)